MSIDTKVVKVTKNDSVVDSLVGGLVEIFTLGTVNAPDVYRAVVEDLDGNRAEGSGYSAEAAKHSAENQLSYNKFINRK